MVLHKNKFFFISKTLFFIGLNVSSDQLRPCEAGHKITFSIAEPQGVQPLTLCFPFPVLVDCIEATLRRTDRSIQVVLKKALNEPWPYDFNLKPKWDVDKFKSWKELNPYETLDELYNHVCVQKGFQQLKNYLGMDVFGNSAHLPEVRLLLPMDIARNTIGTILMQVQTKGCEFFAILKAPAPGQTLSSTANEKPLFFIRAHPPILSSPFNGPMILLSVLDCRLSEKLVKKGHLKEKNAKEDFERIFHTRNKMATPMILRTNTEDSTSLLRYVFRLNSTKMKPSSWQEENLPLGNCSPYLATFLSPLYLDHFPLNCGNQSSKQLSCAGCGKKSSIAMKRCSRCKTMTYCSSACQKTDWKKHKLVCSDM